MKKLGKFFSLIFMCCLLISPVLFTGCFFEDDAELSSSDVTLRNVNMSVEYMDYLEYYSVSITGIADNVSGRKLSYVSLEFYFYDSQGFKLGEATAYTSGMQKGEAWRFEATSLDFPEVQPISFKLIEISAW